MDFNNNIIRTKDKWTLDELTDITGCTDKKLTESLLYTFGYKKEKNSEVYVFDAEQYARNIRSLCKKRIDNGTS